MKDGRKIKGEQMNIEIRVDRCMIYGGSLSPTNKIRGHLIPKSLKPKDNVLVFFHKECEERINKLYVSQEKKDPRLKLINILKDAIVKLTNKVEDLEKSEKW